LGGSQKFLPPFHLYPKQGCHQERPPSSPPQSQFGTQSHPPWLCWGGPSICPSPEEEEGSLPHLELPDLRGPVVFISNSPHEETFIPISLSGTAFFFFFFFWQGWEGSLLVLYSKFFQRLCDRSFGMQQFLSWTFTPP